MQFFNLLSLDLHLGEADAIAPAIEQNADLILMDETDARQVAARFDLKKTGVIGISRSHQKTSIKKLSRLLLRKLYQVIGKGRELGQ